MVNEYFTRMLEMVNEYFTRMLEIVNPKVDIQVEYVAVYYVVN